MEDKYTRRALLWRGGAALGTSGLAVTAGCVGQDDAGSDPTHSPTAGTRSPTDSPRSPTATRTSVSGSWTGPEYGRWLPAPGEVIRTEGYRFGATDLTAIAGRRGELPPGLKRPVGKWQPMDLDWRTVPLVLVFHGNQVIRADYDRGAVVDRVAGTDGWARLDDHGGYTLVQNDDSSKAIAVGDGEIVVAHPYDGTAADTARGILDTAGGRRPRYPAVNDAVDAVMDEFEGGFTSQWLPVEVFDETPPTEPEFDGQVGLGRWGKAGEGEGTEVKVIVVYESAAAVDLAAVRSYVDEHDDEGGQFAPWQDVGVSRNGQLAVISGLIP